MRKGEIIFKICLILLGIAALFAYISEPSRNYEAKWNAFVNCSIRLESSTCAQLFGN